MATENNNQSTNGPWSGRVHNGKFYCACDEYHLAKCRTTTKEGPNKGRRVWGCRRGRKDPDQCDFFVWDDQAAEAMEWLSQHGLPLREPQTPVGKGKEVNNETPWTLSKRKPVRREAFDESENAGPSERNVNGHADEAEAETESDQTGGNDSDSPSRNPAKRARLATPPSPTIEDKMKDAAEVFPTPDTGKKPEAVATASESRTSKNALRASARLEDVIDLTDDDNSDLTESVLNLLRSEIDLKDSLALQIGHIINMEVNSHEAKVRTYEATISKLREQLDEFEKCLI